MALQYECPVILTVLEIKLLVSSKKKKNLCIYIAISKNRKATVFKLNSPLFSDLRTCRFRFS
jgi:hypothetical protein